MSKTIVAIAICMLMPAGAHTQETVAPALHVNGTPQSLFQIHDQKQLKLTLDQADTQLKQGNLKEVAKSISIARQVVINAENINTTGGDANLALPFLKNPSTGEISNPGSLIAVKVLTCDSNEQIVMIGQRSAKCVRQP